MVRSMYSGVAGMKSNQNRLDVIGNNISNANTYGFKSSRATFRDMYYQQVRGASSGTQTRGGINPSSIGYGAKLASVDLMMDSSSMTTTGYALDACITGEGFFQVMDPDGNIYYTKAGMFDIDPATGAVIDSNGNFVLGTNATDGKINSSKPGQEKIFISVNPVQANVAQCVKEISGKTLTITSTNQVKDANISFAFSKGTDMPDGLKVQAITDSSSSVINLKLNANATFANMAELQTEINNAITQAYGGPHPGGVYNFKVEPDPFTGLLPDGTTGPIELTGAQIVETASADYEGGGITLTPDANPGAANTGAVQADGSFLNGFKLVETGLMFQGTGGVTSAKVTHVPANPTGTPPVEEHWEVEMVIGTITYKGEISKDRADSSSGANTLLLKSGKDANDTITVSYPNTKDLPAGGTNIAVTFGNTSGTATATPSQPTHNLGWGKSTFTLTGGTEYTQQDMNNLTGISIGADGTITGTSDAGLQVLGRIDLASFGNARGLMQAGNSYFTETANSGKATLAIAGEGGTGAIKNSSLEMSNVDLAQEFSDMIVTQRGFQASSRLITVSDTMLEELINLKR
ncbi:MAG: flagellar hook-basal body complex protein [Oscillospiraceae bacterium]|jgi:flagellar hook protein FlgE|nr:flagellar hook-basal body complex protein [Oscillospiraceae bacterium]